MAGASLSFFLFCNENAAAKSMQTYCLTATPVALKWSCFSKGQYCGAVTHIGTVMVFFPFTYADLCRGSDPFPVLTL